MTLLWASFYLNIQVVNNNQHIIKMQSAIDGVLKQLQSLLENAKNMQSRYLGEILALEKLINQTQKCIQTIVPKQSVKEQPKKQAPPLSVQDKVDALMIEIETKQKIIEEESIKPKPKFEVKLPQIPVEKKPPVPTANRNEKAVKNLNPAYIPPRNRNEVTGKVTQTTMRTSGQKVFRPQKTSIKKVESKEQIKPIRGSGRQRTSVEKRQSKPEVNAKKSQPNPQIQVKTIQVSKPAQPVVEQNHPRNIIVESKKAISKVKFSSFHKQLQQILSQLSKQGLKNHKSQLQKMLSQCENEQKGHKMHEDNNRKIFIKKANNYAISRHAVYPMSSFQITRNKWIYHPELADFHLLLDSIENQLANLELQKDCRIDKKTHFRIAQSSLIYQQTFQAIKDDFQQSQNNVPQKLDLHFNFADQQETNVNNDEAQWENLNETAFCSQLSQFLSDISQRGTLQRSQLRGLQILSEIGVFRSKRAPLIVMEDEYNSWKHHYDNSNI